MDERPARATTADGAGLQKVFIVGCPRSGTTWLQLLLGQHPSVGTARETNVFRRYLADLERRWTFEVEGGGRDGDAVGIAALLTKDEFWAWARQLPELVFERIRGDDTAVTTIVEKTPNHALHWALILRLYPQARFLHLIRDPRAVVNSLMHASRSWGRRWVSLSAVDEAQRWTRFVTTGREIEAATGNYREIRYERLLMDPAGELAELLTWLDLPHDDAMCADIAESCRIDRLRSPGSDAIKPWSADSEPSGFYRKGEADSWRDELSETQIRTIEYIAGDLMGDLGYEKTADIVRPPARLWLRRGLEWRIKRFRNRVDRLLERL